MQSHRGLGRVECAGLPLPWEAERLFSIDPRFKEKHIKADGKRNNASEDIMEKYYRKHDKPF